MATVHDSPYGGSWYPGDAPELRALLETLFEQSRQRTGPCLLADPIAFVVPHAGLVYSGTVAAAAYRSFRQCRPRRIVLLGFCHRGGPGGVSIPDVDAFRTPLGVVPVDRETAGQLPFPKIAESRLCDHSVEIQLPLAQASAPDTPVIPLYVGQMDDDEAARAAQALAQLAGGGTVFLASSDLTHYGRGFRYEPFPADDEIAARLSDLDQGVMDAAGSLDTALFLESVRDTTVCGYMPVALLLRTLARMDGEEIFQQELDYQTSGDLTGDYRHCVSYAALGYFRASSFRLALAEQELLLESARSTLEHLVRTGERRPMPLTKVTPALMRRAGVFVSLHEGVNLRGCVGNRLPLEPLAQAVPQLALSAALDDPRFEPLKELRRDLFLDISVLSPMKRIRDRRAFRLREHGACVECGWRRGLLLPQVACDRDWTEACFWDALAQKAGLSTSAYDDPSTRIDVFRAQVIQETTR